MDSHRAVFQADCRELRQQEQVAEAKIDRRSAIFGENGMPVEDASERFPALQHRTLILPAREAERLMGHHHGGTGKANTVEGRKERIAYIRPD